MKPVIITAATPGELTVLVSALEGRERLQLCRREAHRGELGGWPVVIVPTGIGKVNAAICVAGLLERIEPELVINTGCAGAYHGTGLAVGDLAIATMEIFGDEGVQAPDGWHSLELIGIPALERKGERYFNSFPLTGWALDKAGYVAEAAGTALQRGAFITVSTVSGTKQRGDELASRFDGICENMEGGAVAQVSLLYGVDCLEVRGVSNLVEERDLSRWDIPLAAERVQAFVVSFIGSLIG